MTAPFADRTFSSTITATATAFITTTIPITTTASVTTPLPPPPTSAAPLKKRYDPAALVRHPSASLAPRQVTVKPSSIPTYASACSGAAGYSSACSCIGVTAARTTAPAPSTTVTITRTAVVTVSGTTPTTPTAPAQCSSLTLQAVGGGDDANGFAIDGLYAQVADSGDGVDDDVIYFVADPSAATVFDLSAAGALSAAGYVANSDAGPAAFVLYFNTQADIDAFGYSPATCSVTPASTLLCVDGTQTRFEICMGLVDAGAGVVFSSTVDAGCVPITFKVLPSC
ncbi:Mucin-2 [Xylographa pallens]|nr:Mucin-2 [Xylographa pallens]